MDLIVLIKFKKSFWFKIATTKIPAKSAGSAMLPIKPEKKQLSCKSDGQNSRC
jgi:hypothetical protein